MEKFMTNNEVEEAREGECRDRNINRISMRCGRIENIDMLKTVDLEKICNTIESLVCDLDYCLTKG